MCVYMCVCIYVCVYIYIYIYIYTYIHTYIYVCINTCTYTYWFQCWFLSMHLRSSVHEWSVHTAVGTRWHKAEEQTAQEERSWSERVSCNDKWCVCVRICVCVCVCMYMCGCTYACKYVCVYIYIQARALESPGVPIIARFWCWVCCEIAGVLFTWRTSTCRAGPPVPQNYIYIYIYMYTYTHTHVSYAQMPALVRWRRRVRQ